MNEENNIQEFRYIIQKIKMNIIQKKNIRNAKYKCIGFNSETRINKTFCSFK